MVVLLHVVGLSLFWVDFFFFHCLEKVVLTCKACGNVGQSFDGGRGKSCSSLLMNGMHQTFPDLFFFVFDPQAEILGHIPSALLARREQTCF